MLVSPRSGLSLLALLLFGGTASAGAQRVDPKRIIDFHVNAEQQNVSLQGSVVEGGRFRLEFASRGIYALSVVQLDAARQLFSVTVFRGEGPPDSATYTAIETATATAHRPAPLRTMPFVSVVIDGTRRAQGAASNVPVSNFTFAAYARQRTALQQDYCCVSCNGIRACGCAVTGDCGYCCVFPCCKPPDQDAANTTPRLLPPNIRFADVGRRRCKTVPDAERLYPDLRPTSGAIASR